MVDLGPTVPAPDEPVPITIVKRAPLDRLRYILIKLEEKEVESGRPPILIYEAQRALDDIERVIRDLVEPRPISR